MELGIPAELLQLYFEFLSRMNLGEREKEKEKERAIGNLQPLGLVRQRFDGELLFLNDSKELRILGLEHGLSGLERADGSVELAHLSAAAVTQRMVVQSFKEKTEL
jgi:hypothetical protein